MTRSPMPRSSAITRITLGLAAVVRSIDRPAEKAATPNIATTKRTFLLILLITFNESKSFEWSNFHRAAAMADRTV